MRLVDGTRFLKQSIAWKKLPVSQRLVNFAAKLGLPRACRHLGVNQSDLGNMIGSGQLSPVSINRRSSDDGSTLDQLEARLGNLPEKTVHFRLRDTKDSKPESRVLYWFGEVIFEPEASSHRQAVIETLKFVDTEMGSVNYIIPPDEISAVRARIYANISERFGLDPKAVGGQVFLKTITTSSGEKIEIKLSRKPNDDRNKLSLTLTLLEEDQRTVLLKRREPQRSRGDRGGSVPA